MVGAYLQPLKAVTNQVLIDIPVGIDPNTGQIIYVKFPLHMILDLMSGSALTQGCWLPTSPAQVAEILNLYHVAFFKVHLTNDGRYQPYLELGHAINEALPVKYYTSEEASHIISGDEYKGTFSMEFEGQKVLELGSGLGLLGQAIKKEIGGRLEYSGIELAYKSAK